MTVEEIERILQTVTEKQTQLAEAQIASDARLVELREIVKQIAVAHKSIIELIGLHEKRLDGHDAAEQATGDKLNALINAQAGLEDRQAKIEESYQILVQLARIQEGRIDRYDIAAQATDDKLNALVNAQIGLEDRQAKIEEISARIAESHGVMINAQAGLEDRQAKIEEISARIAESHGAMINAQAGLEDRQAKIEESYQILVQLARIQEGRIDRYDIAAQATDDKLDALINAQVGLEDRQAKIEEIGAQITESHRSLINAQIGLEDRQAEIEEIGMRIADSHGSIIDLIKLHENRLNGHDKALSHANGKLDALMKPQRKSTTVTKKNAPKKKPRS